MGDSKVEIERKFLVDVEAWKAFSALHEESLLSLKFEQGYILASVCPEKTIRVRYSQVRGVPSHVAEEEHEQVRRGHLDRCLLTIKGPADEHLSRAEIEHDISLELFEKLWEDCDAALVKMRYNFPYAGKLWSVDVFEGALAGLVLAEVELAHTGEIVQLPPWVVEEVSRDARYYNINLARSQEVPTPPDAS